MPRYPHGAQLSTSPPPHLFSSHLFPHPSLLRQTLPTAAVLTQCPKRSSCRYATPTILREYSRAHRCSRLRVPDTSSASPRTPEPPQRPPRPAADPPGCDWSGNPTTLSSCLDLGRPPAPLDGLEPRAEKRPFDPAGCTPPPMSRPRDEVPSPEYTDLVNAETCRVERWTFF